MSLWAEELSAALQGGKWTQIWSSTNQILLCLCLSVCISEVYCYKASTVGHRIWLESICRHFSLPAELEDLAQCFIALCSQLAWSSHSGMLRMLFLSESDEKKTVWIVMADHKSCSCIRFEHDESFWVEYQFEEKPPNEPHCNLNSLVISDWTLESQPSASIFMQMHNICFVLCTGHIRSLDSGSTRDV
jgi:hypothetical protein